MAIIIVEDGSIVENANSYSTVDELEDYAADRGITLSGDASELLIQAMDYLESLNYIGFKKTKDQSLQWPRSCVFIDGYSFPNYEIPKELKKSQLAVAVAIDQGLSPLSTLERATTRERVGEIEVAYSDSSATMDIARTIPAALSKLISGGMIGYTVRKA